MLAVGPTVLITLYLNPIINSNQQTIDEIEDLQTRIDSAQPQIQGLTIKKTSREQDIVSLAGSLPKTAPMEERLENFVDRLKSLDIEFVSENTGRVDLGLQSVRGVSVLATIRTDFLTWLRERNRFLRSETFARVPIEKIKATGEGNLVEIEFQIILPSSAN